MVGLHYLKYSYDLSDEEGLEQWLQNPYWQYLCGMKHFEHELPIEVSTMSRWYKRLEVAGTKKMLTETLVTGIKRGWIEE